jgi:hypothetical protein
VLRLARQLIISQELLAGAVDRNSLVIVCPAVDPGGAELFGIRHGRLFEQCSLPDVADPATGAVVLGFLERLRAAAAAPPVVGQQEIDAIIIISQWLARYEESPQVIRLPAEPASDTVDSILATARAIHALPVAAESTTEWAD